MAGTVTYKKNVIRNDNEKVEEHVWSWVADASNGTVPSTASDAAITGWAAIGETNPGSPAPTALYDIVVNDSRGMDVFGGELADRSTSVTEPAMPKIGNAYGENFVNSVLTVVLTNNSVNSAVGEFRLIVRKGNA